MSQIQVKDVVIINYLDSVIPNNYISTNIGEWYLSQLNAGLTHEQLETYILDTYLPSLGYTPENMLFFKDGFVKYEMAYAQDLLAYAALQPSEAIMQESAATEAIKVFTEEAQAQIQDQLQTLVDGENSRVEIIQEQPIIENTEVFNQVAAQELAIANLNEPIIPQANVEEMRKLQAMVDENLVKIMLLKEESKHNENYINDSYKYCPSFKNLIEPVQQAIIAKRRQKANEKWFEKYRPELVEEVLFPNQVIKETITEFALNGHIGGNCMFYGEGGVGKTTTNIILMNAVLQNVADRFLLDRKIESVDELKGWLNKKPIGKQKIVIAEEFDRLSDAAMTELKNGLMEKYEYVVFLASTNKIHKIDDALLTRFTVIAKFESAQEEDLYNKCKYILSNERITYTEDGLRYFIENNKIKGIRTILNNLQLSCYQNLFEPKRTSFYIGNSGTEYDMVQWIKYYIGYLLQLPKQTLLYLTYSLDNEPNIKQVRDSLLQTLMANYSLNYDYVFTELLKDNIFLPIKNCINTYYQDIDTKRIKAMHFEAMLNDMIMIAHNTKDVYAVA